MRSSVRMFAVLPALLLAVSPAFALIKNLLPLKDVLATEEYIFTAKVEKLLPDKPAVVFTVTDALKGKPPFQRMAVSLAGDALAKREQETPKLLKRLAPSLTVLVFAHKQGKGYQAFVYSNGTWFQMRGQMDGTAVRWSFNHLEPYLRRTFKGTTGELKQVIVDGLSGKREPPKPDEKEPPGIGPEVGKEPKQSGPSKFPLAVIPTFVIVGPLAILATLFPAVFGGLALLMRRWMVALSLSCLLSTIYFLQLFFYSYLQRTWLGNGVGLWLTFGVLAALSAIWAGRRFRKAVADNEADAWAPNKWDRITLLGLSAIGAVTILIAVYLGRDPWRSPWLDVVATFAPVWLTSCAILLCANRSPGTPGTSLETVFLWSLTVACLLVAALETGRSDERGRARSIAANVDFSSPRLVPKPAWKFEPSGSGMILSNPTLDNGRVYVGSLMGGGFKRFGRIYAIDAENGQQIWQFDDAEGMRPVFSSPCVWNKRVYVGEGFHEDGDCRVLCLNADTGEKIWEFPTTSHTESSPVVVDGKLYIGAGDDGLYCLNADNGKIIWHYEKLHIDATVAMHEGCVYVGSGVGDKYNSTVLLCLNAADGKEIWKVPLEYASFASPTVVGEHVFVGTGNGNFSVSNANPRGQVLCLNARTGKRIWQFDAKDAVLCQPAVDQSSVWFTCRDGLAYCVRRGDGRLRWKYDARAPIVASPVLVADGEGSVIRSLYVASSNGLVTCLDPDRGTAFWSLDLAADAKQPQALLGATPAVRSRRVEGIERRTLYIGFAAGRDLSQLSTSLPRLCSIEDEVK